MAQRVARPRLDADRRSCDAPAAGDWIMTRRTSHNATGLAAFVAAAARRW